MLYVGMLFHDRYELKRQLGRGGFSEVWLALDTKVNHDVAIKVYATGTGLDDEAVTLFMQEFSLVYDLNHTNLLKPTTYDDWDNIPYLVMPYKRQGSIYKYVLHGERLTEDQCWHLLHDVAAGLAFLHDQMPPIIHRDIKPDNILIDDAGIYMITDFGISSSIRKTFHRANAEQGTGTLAYMAPECFSSNPKPVMASDIWALGATMFEVMTADQPPFGNHGGLIQRNGGDMPTIDGPYSDELKDIIYHCLAKEPWDRPRAHEIEKITYEHIEGITDTLRPSATVRQSNPKPQSAPTPDDLPQPTAQPAPEPQPVLQSEPEPAPQPTYQPTPASQPAPAPAPAYSELTPAQQPVANPPLISEPAPQQGSPSIVPPSTPTPSPQPESPLEPEPTDKPKKKKRKKKKKPTTIDNSTTPAVATVEQPQAETQPEAAPQPTVRLSASSPDEPVLNESPGDDPTPDAQGTADPYSPAEAQKSLPIGTAKFPWLSLALTSAAGLLIGVLLHFII